MKVRNGGGKQEYSAGIRVFTRSKEPKKDALFRSTIACQLSILSSNILKDRLMFRELCYSKCEYMLPIEFYAELRKCEKPSRNLDFTLILQTPSNIKVL